MYLWAAMSQELIEEEQRIRRQEINAMYKREETLALAGYVSPAARLRAATAAGLLRLALRLDKRLADRTSAPSALRHA